MAPLSSFVRVKGHVGHDGVSDFGQLKDAFGMFDWVLKHRNHAVCNMIIKRVSSEALKKTKGNYYLQT